MLLGAGLFFAYQWTGALVVRWLRVDLWSETWGALLNVLTWPVGPVMQLVVWPVYRRRRERARQARIAAKVASGEYAVEHARNLGWRG